MLERDWHWQPGPRLEKLFEVASCLWDSVVYMRRRPLSAGWLLWACTEYLSASILCCPFLEGYLCYVQVL